MVRSSTAEVRSLIDALDSPSATRRESAAARLAIIGPRAVASLVTAFTSTLDRQKQLAIVRVLEVAGDERALPVARAALGAGGDVAVAAVALLRALLERGGGSTHAEALGMLLAASSDAAYDRRIRAAAASALTSAPADIRRAIGNRLQTLGSDADVVWEDAAEGRLPENTGAVMEALDLHAARAPLPVLGRVLDAVRTREEELAGAGRSSAGAEGARSSWCAVRGALHQVLAARGSRMALYDLRESLEAAAHPLPSSFLAAVRTVGDTSCLEPLATAFARASRQHPGWRGQLAEVFQAIARRERLTKRHAAVRRALARAPELAHVLTAPAQAGQLLGQ